MDILYCAGLQYGANWRNRRHGDDPERMWAEYAASPSGFGRLTLALVVIAIGAGFLSHVSERNSDTIVAPRPADLGALQ
jgi:hypothetical protein